MYGLLNGMTVIEGASFVAAPSAGLYLSQMGAEVIRFDDIGGGPDFNRWPVTENGASLYWEGLNKGKKSVAINLRVPEGRDLAAQLITAQGADRGLFLTNYPVSGFLAHEALRAARDDLITIRIMGQRDARPAVDYTINCAVGYPMMTGPDTLDAPVNHVLPAWDLLCGAYAAFSLMTAERHRARSGKGAEIKVPLSDMAAATLSNLGQIGEVLTGGGDREKVGNGIFGMFGRDFATRDKKRVMITVITPRHWQKLTALLQIEAQAADLEKQLKVDFTHDEGARFIHRERLFPLLEQRIGDMDFAALVDVLESAGLVWGPYRSVHEAANDPFTVADNPLFTTIRQPSGLDYPVAGAPASLADTDRQPPRPAPQLGAHTEEVLLDYMQLGSGAFATLVDKGIVALAGGSNDER